MPTLSEQLKRLVNTSRGRGRLDPAATRESIAASISTGLPTTDSDPQATGGGGGVDSPLVEQAYTGSTYYQVISSDGLFVFEFGDQTEYIDDDGNGSTIVFKHLDPSA